MAKQKSESINWMGATIMILGIALGVFAAIKPELSDMDFVAGMMFGVGLMSL